MEDGINVSSGDGGTGGTTSSPQNTGQLSSDSQNPQTSVNGATINYEASNNTIPLEPTNQLTATTSKPSTSSSAHSVDMTAIIAIIVLVIAAVALAIYFYETAKRKSKYD